MLINKDTAVSTSRITLVPYEAHHVPTYHGWMKDPDIQHATASEPLSLEEEYAMQQSWRSDPDKLTFITCVPIPPSSLGTGLPAGTHDHPANLLGDVNLFVTSDEEEDESLFIGEIELMIADKSTQGQGYGRASLLAFLAYLSNHELEVLSEYATAKELTEFQRFGHLKVKIGESNARSLGLFEGVGFVKVSEEVNYFGEWEMNLEGGLREFASRFGEDAVPGYREIRYERDPESGGAGCRAGDVEMG